MSKPRAPWLFHLITALVGSTAALAAAAARAEVCAAGPVLDAARNAASFETLPVAPFRRPEIGWAIYEAWIKSEIGTSCSAVTPAFAGALARFRADHGLGAGGVMDAPTLAAMNQLWTARRPFVRISKIACPAPPLATTLATALSAESYGGKTIQLRPGALSAYRRLYAAARAAGVTTGIVGSNRTLLTIFSGFRDPAADAARCAAEGNCQGVSRASCSAHLTGLAMDLTLGSAPGHTIDSADDINRLYISYTPVYRWLVANAGRFGFVNYVFEPWHWEWTGEAP